MTAIDLFDIPTEKELVKKVMELKKEKRAQKKSHKGKKCLHMLLKLHHHF